METIRSLLAGETKDQQVFFAGNSTVDSPKCRYSKLCWILPTYCESEEHHHVRNGLIASVLRHGYLNPAHRAAFLSRVKPSFAERIEADYRLALDEGMPLQDRSLAALGTFHPHCRGFPPIIHVLLETANVHWSDDLWDSSFSHPCTAPGISAPPVVDAAAARRAKNDDLKEIEIFREGGVIPVITPKGSPELVDVTRSRDQRRRERFEKFRAAQKRAHRSKK